MTSSGLQPPAPTEPSGEEQAAVPVAELPGCYFELYKLAVEMADRVSGRRALANSFFLTANTAIVALLANQDARWYMPAAGILFSIVWWALLQSYRDLNSAKFEVILKMEKQLPVGVYGEEWEQLRGRTAGLDSPGQRHRFWGGYRELGQVERVVPWAFALIYLADILRQLLG